MSLRQKSPLPKKNKKDSSSVAQVFCVKDSPSCAWLQVQSHQSIISWRVVRASHPSATKHHSRQLGCCWNPLRGRSLRGGGWREAGLLCALISPNCWVRKRVQSGRRFKIMLLQAVREREREKKKNPVPWSNVLHHLKGKWHLQTVDVKRTDVAASVQFLFFFSSWNSDLAAGDVQLAGKGFRF